MNKGILGLSLTSQPSMQARGPGPGPGPGELYKPKVRSYSFSERDASESTQGGLSQYPTSPFEEELTCQILDNYDSHFIILPEGKQISFHSDFIEWFRGFTDAQGCFLIVKSANTFAFRFLIKLHADDAPVLDFIQNNLGIGRVTIYLSSAIFAITAQK